MQTKPKSNSTITHAIRWPEDGTAPVLTFTVLGVVDKTDDNPTGAQSFTLDLDKTSEKNDQRAMVHGYIQRVSDGGAISRDPETGLPATAQSKFERMRRIAEHYEAGGDEWSMKAAPGTRGPDAGLILTAMCRTVAEGSIDRANELVEGIAKKRGVDRNEALRAWGQTPTVLKAIAEIKAERAPKGADDLLAEMMEPEPAPLDIENHRRMQELSDAAARTAE